MKTLIRQIDKYTRLYRDNTGLAWIENGHTGLGHSCHPNISDTGRPRIVYGKRARIVYSHGFAYNTDSVVVTDPLDEIARKACQCGGSH
jgi:hypothetical protein